jgi:hypothetical protein
MLSMECKQCMLRKLHDVFNGVAIAWLARTLVIT